MRLGEVRSDLGSLHILNDIKGPHDHVLKVLDHYDYFVQVIRLEKVCPWWWWTVYGWFF